MMMMSAGDNSWLVHQSSLLVLPAETSWVSRMNGRSSENIAYQCLKYLKGSLACRKILRHGPSSLTFHPKEGVLRIFIALENPSPRLGLNPRPLGSVASTLTTRPPRRLHDYATTPSKPFRQARRFKQNPRLQFALRENGYVTKHGVIQGPAYN
jgi:hypothetical protein